MKSIWAIEHGSPVLWVALFGALLGGMVLLAALTKTPTQLRSKIVAGVTFVCGLFYVLLYIWPEPIGREEGTLPRNVVESVAFQLKDSVPVVVSFTNIIAAFLLGLGVYSLLRIHLMRIAKQQKDWAFSVVLLTSMVSMATFAYADWAQKLKNPALEGEQNWGFVQYGRDFFFDKLLQQMDAAMFSIIAFFILSAAYRAFRVRSVEATILLAAAFLVMLSFLGLVQKTWDDLFANAGPMLQNFKLTEIAAWIRSTFQTPAISGIRIGVGIGTVAMALRIWLSLEKGGR